MKKKTLVYILTFAVCITLILFTSFVVKMENDGEFDKQTDGTASSTVSPVSPQTNKPTQDQSVKQTAVQSSEVNSSSGVKKNLSDYFTSISTAKVFNNELQIYISSQVAFSGNSVKMTAEKLPTKYISGKVESKFAFRYGEFHFRVNCVKGKGLFPAIWLMPTNGELFPEIDIFEMLGNNPNTVTGVMHYMQNNEQKKYSYSYSFPKDNIPKSYDIKFKWTKDSMTWTVNGKQMLKVSENVPNIPMYLIFNLAVGGDWPGSPDTSTVFPSSFNVTILDIKPQEIFSR